MPKQKWNPPLQKVRLIAARMATYKEIAAAFDVSESLVKKTAVTDDAFREAIEKGRAEGCLSLRGKQFEMAMAGSVPMAIYLGKQYLGQNNDGQSTEAPKNTLLSKYMPAPRFVLPKN
jgi:hypothetical protein